MWFDDVNDYYWRARCLAEDSTAIMVIEYISRADVENDVDNWIENTNARIVCLDFGGIKADFTIRSAESNLPVTVFYSDGTDVYIAESDEASPTGWAWENVNKVFDASEIEGAIYQRVNFAANRQTPTSFIWATAVCKIDIGGGGFTYQVKTKHQTNAGDLTNWDAAVDISDVIDGTNGNQIWGQSVRSMGESGAQKKEMIFVWKEDVYLKSRYHALGWENIQNIPDGAAVPHYPGVARFDLEHGITAGEDHAHIIYVEADNTIQWSERDPGVNGVSQWNAATCIADSTAAIHGAVGIIEHGSGNLYVAWKHNDVIEYRTHPCDTEIWSPLVSQEAYVFDPSVDAVVTTSTIWQIQTADSVSADDHVILNWIGHKLGDWCDIGWGKLALPYTTSSTSTTTSTSTSTSTSTTTTTTSTSTSTSTTSSTTT